MSSNPTFKNGKSLRILSIINISKPEQKKQPKLRGIKEIITPATGIKLRINTINPRAIICGILIIIKQIIVIAGVVMMWYMNKLKRQHQEQLKVNS